ncbi:MAG: hypothetical protein V1790_09135 [Planctomycetota bacterium]
MTRKAKRRLVFVGFTSLAAIAIGALTIWYIRYPAGAVCPFKTGLDEYDGNVLLRFTQPRSDELLLCYLTSLEDRYYVRGTESGINALSPVFRYSLANKTFKQVKFSEWLNAAGEIASCKEQWMLPNPAWNVNSASHSLTFNQKHVTTAGRIVLQSVIAPSGGLVAVLSADGEYKDASGLFFYLSSPQSASGRRTHEVFRADSAERIGAPVRLADAGKGLGTVPCWSPDDRVVVYFGGSHEKFWFIETGPGTVGEP